MVEFTTNKVRGLMAENRLTLVDVATELNISISALQRRLNNEIDFKVDEIKQLARLFNVDFTISKEA